AHRVRAALSRSVALNTGLDEGTAAHHQTPWVADVGLGVLRVSKTDARAASAVGMGRGMSRAALGYASRVAWFDESSGEIVDMPVLAD
ncbi:MAG: GGDEF domain-containing protein, partial [Polaromonas sp.]|nr:GGDEF domain-containing protein [Polaromonas sp.]